MLLLILVAQPELHTMKPVRVLVRMTNTEPRAEGRPNVIDYLVLSRCYDIFLG